MVDRHEIHTGRQQAGSATLIRDSVTCKARDRHRIIRTIKPDSSAFHGVLECRISVRRAKLRVHQGSPHRHPPAMNIGQGFVTVTAKTRQAKRSSNEMNCLGKGRKAEDPRNYVGGETSEVLLDTAWVGMLFFLDIPSRRHIHHRACVRA